MCNPLRNRNLGPVVVYRRTTGCLMPNGGPDCCGHCVFNFAIQRLGPLHILRLGQWKQFWNDSYCTLRSVAITEPFWTYCANYSHDANKTPGAKATGSIFANGLYEEGYARIPWHGSAEPKAHVPATCFICCRKTASGIVVTTTDNALLGFCSNRHYVAWWRTQHDDPGIRADDFADPEAAMNRIGRSALGRDRPN
jgi:hypothetical protein